MGKVASGASQIGLQRYEKAKGAYFLERKCSNFLGSPKFFGG